MIESLKHTVLTKYNQKKAYWGGDIKDKSIIFDAVDMEVFFSLHPSCHHTGIRRYSHTTDKTRCREQITEDILTSIIIMQKSDSNHEFSLFMSVSWLFDKKSTV